MDEYKRAPAIRLWITDVLTAHYTRGDTPLTPHTLTLPNNETANRIALCGTIVNNTTTNNTPTLLMDDGTGTITLRAFEHQLQHLTTGTLIHAIGRPRQFLNTTYLLLDTIKPLPNNKWFDLWKKTVTLRKPPETTPTNIINLIREQDTGTGADVDNIIKKSNIVDGETIIADLLLKGEIFEVSPGKIKVLE